VHQLDGHASSLREMQVIHSAGMGDSSTQLGTNSGTARKNSMTHGGHQTWGGGSANRLVEMLGQRLLRQLM
jgi:hypothetical protein